METNSHRRNNNRMRGLGQRFLLRLIAIALIASACSMIIAMPADAAQRQRPAQDRIVQTADTKQAPPTTQSPERSTRPAPAPVLADDTKTQLQPDVMAFVASTALPAQAEFAELFDRKSQDLFAVSPVYQEPVVVSENQLTIDRTITYELAPGVCNSASNRRTLGDLCFAVDTSEEITPEIAKHVADIRAELAAARGAGDILPGISIAEARKMSDFDLLELSLNSGPSSISRTSTMPLAADGSLIALDPNDPVVASTFSSFDMAPANNTFTDDDGSVAPFDFDTEYFLTGFTAYRSYSDEWSYEKDAWWHPRVFVRFSYSLSAGFGVRAPFSIDVDYVSGNAAETVVAVSVDPVSLDVAAEHVGLPSDAYFDGKEVVLELNFDCELEASVAGFGGSIECDDIYSIDTNFSRDFDPVIGNETRNIENWFLWDDGESPLRREIANGAIYAEVNLGIGADVVDGRVGVQIDAGANTEIDGVIDGETAWFNDRNAQYITVDRATSFGGSGFEVSNPEYGFNISVRPKVKFTAGIDTSVYEKDWSFITPLDFIDVSVGFGLDHHDNTVESHNYELYSGVNVEAPISPEASQLAAP